MIACLGLHDGYQGPRFDADRLVERWPRLDIFWLNRTGALVQGTVTEAVIEGTGGGPPAIRTVNVCRIGGGVTIDETLVRLIWDEAFGVERPWFACPACGRRCRYVYLRATIACARCHRLQNASRHLRRQTPGVGRVERLRRKLGGCDTRPFGPLPARIRRGRSRDYHDRLVAAILDEEEALLAHLGGVVHDLKRRIRVRKERGQW